jgi:uncharacterized protein YbjT (DUF2867 family)
MKIVVIGGSGLIGKKLVNNLRRHGHEVVAASPSSVSTPHRRGMGLYTKTARCMCEACESLSEN